MVMSASFQDHRKFLSDNPGVRGHPQVGQNGHLPPLEIGSKNQTFLKFLRSAAYYRLFDLILAMTFTGMTFTLYSSHFRCFSVMW